MDDQDPEGGSPPILPDEGGEEGTSKASAPEVGPSESPMFVDQESDEDAPSESDTPDRASPLRESPMFVEQEPGGTNSPENDDTASPEPVEQGQEEAQAEPEQPEVADSPEGEPAPGQGEGDEDIDGSGPAEVEYEDNSSDDPDACTRACQAQARNAARRLRIANKRVEAKDRIIDDLRDKLAAAKKEIKELKNELKEFQGPADPLPKPTWKQLLRKCLANDGSYYDAWTSSYRALNMSINAEMVHPQIRFIGKDIDANSLSRHNSPDDLASVSSGEEIYSAMPPLPDSILYKILTELLTMDGLVHCFSRLDPHCQPESFPTERQLTRQLRKVATGIRGRFFISKEDRVSISLSHDTEDPGTVLAALCVSRKFAWYGIHIFYGVNSFSFSSFGEMDRFATGSGPARWSRSRKRLNRRTMPLAWFCETASLKTLCIHISESRKSVIRRPYEPESQKLYMKGKTAGQPNWRMTRSLRNCMGMDYIYQLRGLYWVRFYDLDKENADPRRSRAKIRDKSFKLDVERVATQEKVPARAENSRLENLDRLFPDADSWTPSQEDFDRIRPIYNEDTGYDNRCNDLDIDATSSQDTIGRRTPSDLDSGGSDDDNDSGPALHTPPRPSRRRRTFTPAPGPADFEEAGGIEDEGNEFEDGDSEDDENESVTTEDPEHLPLPKAQSEGGLVSHLSSDIVGARRQIIEIEDDDDLQEIPEPTPAPTSARLASRLSLFVTPGSGTSGTPDPRRRSTSGLPGRGESSATAIDLTNEDSDDEAEVIDDAYLKFEESGSPGPNDEGLEEVGDGSPAGRLNPGSKRARLRSPVSEGGGKRQKSNEHRNGSSPWSEPQWGFPEEA
ncbi:hypothetical protein N8I77_011141 [Diaporthe amygdali]|uniref:Uncharacterized protein n=1 Tax=Phomopsis amygdali TaxID=1214568 RepID=A0AAD9S4T7_PHOAM|nr:hypothetical protein N8I77_011141 [Diaporthe amygdali]